MANRIKVATENAIVVLHKRGWSFRRISRELGIHRDTVSRYVTLARSNPAKVPPGTEGLSKSKPAKATAGNLVGRSRCEPFREVVKEMLDAGLSAQRIWQDLVADYALAASYSSVKRFVRRLGKAGPLPFRRMECDPGAEGQVDFGRGAPIEIDGRRRYPHAFRIVLSHSRKGYSEVVWRQTTENFIRVLENAFYEFGGVPRVLIIDNLRAAVKQADWYDPELNPKIEEFCRHYGAVILPAKPYMPRHKGKVEAGVKYLRNNALKGRVFKSLTEENQHLETWERQVADHRIHGTTRKQVGKLFAEAERSALLPLPPTRFPFFHEGERCVHRDAHVEVDKAYYSVPPEYLGRKVWVRWDSRIVRVFNQRIDQIAVHVKKEKGRFSTDPKHIASEKISGVERGAAWLLKRIARIGPHTAQWGHAMLEARGIPGVRVLQGLLNLGAKHSAHELETACEAALSHGAFRLAQLRALIRVPAKQEMFLESHPLIRPLSHYAGFVNVTFGPDGATVGSVARQGGQKDEFVASGAASGEQKGPDCMPGPPRCIATGHGARVALQQSSILRAGKSNPIGSYCNGQWRKGDRCYE